MIEYWKKLHIIWKAALTAIALLTAGGTFVTIYATNEYVDKEIQLTEAEIQELEDAINKQIDLLAMRLDQKIVKDKKDDIVDEIWDFESYYRCTDEESCQRVMNERDMKRYKKLLLDLKELEK
jgi:hypothetical protein